MVAAGAIGVGTLLAAPWTGWWTLALFVPAGIQLLTLDRFLDRSDSPELIALGTLLAMMVVMAAAAAGTGGPGQPRARLARHPARRWRRCAFAGR